MVGWRWRHCLRIRVHTNPNMKTHRDVFFCFPPRTWFQKSVFSGTERQIRAVGGYIGHVRYIARISKGIQDLSISFISIYALKWSVSASSVCVCLGVCPLPLPLRPSERSMCKDASFPPPPLPHNTTSMEDTSKENETAAWDEIVLKRRNNGSIIWKWFGFKKTDELQVICRV